MYFMSYFEHKLRFMLVSEIEINAFVDIIGAQKWANLRWTKQKNAVEFINQISYIRRLAESLRLL